MLLLSLLLLEHELIYFSLNDNKRAYDIGDIYTAYGSPKTNELIMNYQWTDQIKKFPIDNDNDKDNIIENNNIQNYNISNNYQNKNINNQINNNEINDNNKISDEENLNKVKLENIKEEDESSKDN